MVFTNLRAFEPNVIPFETRLKEDNIFSHWIWASRGLVYKSYSETLTSIMAENQLASVSIQKHLGSESLNINIFCCGLLYPNFWNMFYEIVYHFFFSNVLANNFFWWSWKDFRDTFFFFFRAKSGRVCWSLGLHIANYKIPCLLSIWILIFIKSFYSVSETTFPVGSR